MKRNHENVSVCNCSYYLMQLMVSGVQQQLKGWDVPLVLHTVQVTVSGYLLLTADPFCDKPGDAIKSLSCCEESQGCSTLLPCLIPARNKGKERCTWSSTSMLEAPAADLSIIHEFTCQSYQSLWEQIHLRAKPQCPLTPAQHSSWAFSLYQLADPQ